MTPCLLRGEQSGVDLLLHQRVILGELAHLTLPDQIDPRIAHVSNDVPRFREKKRGDRASHAELVAFRAGSLVDCAVRVAKRPRNPSVRVRGFQIVQVRQVMADHVHRHLARDFTRRVPTHPVRDDEQSAIGVGRSVQRVFIPFSDTADISASRNSKVH
jgi:hypothetical protein